MKQVEISDDLYEKIMQRDKDHLGKPFEVLLWDLIASNESQKQMLNETMSMMLAAAVGKSPEEMKKIRQQFKDEEYQDELRRGKVGP